ncbi:glycoside hydrolase superfamily [Cadophora sp. MPI-SDFR-AT-0126]|nr:glycoside hydrolase superfamily [Leotiomycetes sp. MPI-SDFR-AT-0126]
MYLKPFEIAIKATKPWVVMTSYNLVKGLHVDLNDFLIRKVLRDEWHFQGLVSDWGGTNSVVASIAAGLDLEMPGPAVVRKSENVKAALTSGGLMPEAIDAAAPNALDLLVKAGRFEFADIARNVDCVC